MLAPNAKVRAEIVPGEPVTINGTIDDLDSASHHAVSARMSWARLLKRVFDIEIEHCGSTIKIIAAIEEPAVITKILAHLDLPTRAPPRAPARAFNLYDTA